LAGLDAPTVRRDARFATRLGDGPFVMRFSFRKARL
jgi:hypothetical protein